MKHILLLIAFSVSAFTLFAQNPGDKIIGEYWTPKKNGKIAIYKKGNLYSGKLTWVEKNRRDEKNPNAALRNRELIGMEFLTGFKYDAGDKEWIDGKIYDAESGKTYSCKMWINGNNLKVRGYIGISMFGRTEEFIRIR